MVLQVAFPLCPSTSFQSASLLKVFCFLHITVSSANVGVHEDYCLTSFLSLSITTANKKKGAGSALKAISPPPWPPHQSCTTTHRCHLNPIHIQLCSRLLHNSVFSLHLTMSHRGSFWTSLNFSNATIASEVNSPFRWSSRTGWEHVFCYSNLVVEPDVNLNVPLICISEQPV